MSFVTGFKQILKVKLDGLNSGFIRHGDTFLSTKYKSDAEYDTDYFIQFNIFNPYFQYKRPSKNIAYEYITNSNKPYLVGEEGAFRQFPNYKRFGWYNYKNGIGLFNNDDVDNTRWKKFQKDTKIKIKDWNSPGDYILIMGQLERDSAIIDIYDSGYNKFDDYINEQIKIIRSYTDRPIIYRPHPVQFLAEDYADQNPIFRENKNVFMSENYDSNSKLHGGSGLKKDLKNAHCVVMHSSNSGVEAITEGIPVFSLSNTSSVYEISHTDLSQIENLKYDIDITEWCNKIAYTVWSEEEIAEGLMWEHFKSYYEK